ncbi:MAG: hypothetical protein LBS94_05885 [Prevotellaceae bacterium]|jgi:hypothetical protein|nr:hypothetical protein [Prevotellaceae bacterium]
MVKKKKKLSFSEQQKQQQLKQAQYKNLFVEKLRAVCAAIGDPKLFDLIPASELICLYYMRGAPLKIKVATGARIQKRLIEVMEASIKKVVNETQIEMMPDSGRTISLTDYFLAGSALDAILHMDVCAIKERERFDKFAEHSQDHLDFYVKTVRTVCESVCNMYDNIALSSSLYAFNFDISTQSNQVDKIKAAGRFKSTLKDMLMGKHMYADIDMRLHPEVGIFTMPLDVKQVRVDGEIRSAMKLGSVFYPEPKEPDEEGEDAVPTLRNLAIPSSVLGADEAFADRPLPVYIQQHALHRLMERTGCKVPSRAIRYLNQSIENPVVVRFANAKFFINYRIEEHKVGYLLCEKISNFVLIRTFLFLTNSGSPEGDKLAAITSLQKDDCEYLAINNLRSFLSSDILDNETLCKIFQKAGCQPLLDLCQKVKEDDLLKTLFGIEEHRNSISDLMTEYLNPHADNDEYVVGE